MLGANVACKPSRPVAVLETHGNADPIVPFNGGIMTGRGGVSNIVAAPAMVDRWRQLDGCQDVQEVVLPNTGDGTQSVRSSPTCSAGTDVVFMRIDGGGHTWPEFDASEASAQFFNAHAR